MIIIISELGRTNMSLADITDIVYLLPKTMDQSKF